MRVAEALRAAAARLGEISDTARLDAEVLMAHALGVSRSDMIIRHSVEQAPDIFDTHIERRAASEPVAYIIGEQEFFGRTFLVNRNVLIPRGDSETVVEAALDAVPAPARVLDCGVGSGALLLTVLAECPPARGVGIDCSAGAREVAERNAAQLGLEDRVQVRDADWKRQDWAGDLGQFDLILANPPYVEEDADLDASVRDYEPHTALFAGPEGLDDYRMLIPQLPPLLAENGIAVLEIGATQAEAVAQIAAEHGFAAQLRKDLAGRPRATILRLLSH